MGTWPKERNPFMNKQNGFNFIFMMPVISGSFIESAGELAENDVNARHQLKLRKNYKKRKEELVCIL